MHSVIFSVVLTLFRAGMLSLNLSDSLRSIESESLYTAFSPRISLLCVKNQTTIIKSVLQQT